MELLTFTKLNPTTALLIVCAATSLVAYTIKDLKRGRRWGLWIALIFILGWGIGIWINIPTILAGVGQDFDTTYLAFWAFVTCWSPWVTRAVWDGMFSET